MCVKYGWLMPVFRYLTKDGSKTRNATKASSLVNCGRSKAREQLFGLHG